MRTSGYKALLIAMLCGTLQGAWDHNRVYVGTIQFPAAMNHLPTLTAYHRGVKIDISDGAFELVDSTAGRELYILFTLGPVCPRSTGPDEPNTINSFELCEGAPYRCYKIQQNMFYQPHARTQPEHLEPHQEPWFIEEIKLTQTSKKQTRVPDNTLLMLINPLLLTGLKNQPWSCVGNACKLPTVLLKDTLSTKAIADMSTTAALTALDLDPFHRKPTTVKEYQEKNPGVVLSITTD